VGDLKRPEAALADSPASNVEKPL